MRAPCTHAKIWTEVAVLSGEGHVVCLTALLKSIRATHALRRTVVLDIKVGSKGEEGDNVVVTGGGCIL